MMTIQTPPAAPASTEIPRDSLVWFRNKGSNQWSLGQLYYHSNTYRTPVVTCLAASVLVHFCVDEVRPVDLGSQSKEVWDWIFKAVRRAEVEGAARIKELVAEA